MTENLSIPQLNLLHAILNQEEQLSSQSTLKKYKLTTSSNVVRLKKGLINSEIIDEADGKIEFLDPIYALWLKNDFMKE